MDIQKIINTVLEKLEGNDNLVNRFMKEPVKVLEELTGVDLPDEQINAVVEGVKAKLNLDETVKGARGVLDSVMGLVGKKVSI